MASTAASAFSIGPPRLQTPAVRAWLRRFGGGIEDWLEAERDQLPLWLPVMLGAGIAAWYLLPNALWWTATMLVLVAFALAALAVGRHDRACRMVAVAALVMAAGVALIWWRAERVRVPVLTRPALVQLTARVERVERLPARELLRLRLAPITVDADPQARRGRPNPPPKLPPVVRVNLDQKDMPAGLGQGAIVKLRARLMPPPAPAVPGAYDYARVAWFDGLGAIGRGFAPVTVITPGAASGDGIREALTHHIQASLPGSAGGIAAAFVTGDVGGIAKEDADAMRRAGVAHLLSVSGLHVTAVVGATMLLAMRLLALWPWLALRVRLPLIAAGAGALAAIGYTWLSGAEVPTVRSCVAALLVLAAIAAGREAITLRLVAAGAFLVLLVWPDALVGPSFQLSFAAVTAIVALHEQPTVRGWFRARDEARWHRLGRHTGSLLLTGFVIELVLAPIGLYHFHQTGTYGALANLVAIPLSTFVIMPAEALALALDPVGLGSPAWWVTGRAIDLLTWISRATAAAPGSQALLPTVPAGAYALMVSGGLWLALWRTRVRLAGFVPFAVGVAWALTTPAPDLLVTNDGRHLAIRTVAGVAILRDRTGDYTSDTLTENLGSDGEPELLSDQPFARCNADSCVADVTAGGRRYRLLATRSGYPVDRDQLIRACAGVDIVVSERRLPSGCKPRRLKLDQAFLRRAGGVAISLASETVRTTKQPGDRHPWIDPGGAEGKRPRSRR